MDDEATQPSTQNKFDPRRAGRNNSSLTDADISDVLCTLHPSSSAAFRIVASTAKNNPQHILQNASTSPVGDFRGMESSDELETILLDTAQRKQAQDLALRFSSHVINPALGFCFGRNSMKCDINLDIENQQKRVSNTHFRIYVNNSNVLMLEDFSTNGTVVDGVTLGGKKYPQNSKTRMLSHGSAIEILAVNPEDHIKFILTVPSRDGHVSEYRKKFQAYMAHVAIAERRADKADQGPPMPEAAVRGMLAAPLAGPANTKAIPTINPPGINSNFGMHWNGGETYACTGVLGKGAFATVYQLARKMDGELFAVKELEKRRFMKNGILDTRLDNEMQIMQGLRHPNIVQYINYEETEHHLYIIMEYVSCGDLQGYTQAHAKLQESQGKDMTCQILSALQYLHNKNITHRDIKPDNIMICSEIPFVVKLTDFGLSKVVKNNETFLKTFCGTLLYCAPEVFPHYDAYVAGKRQKRRRHSQEPDSHRYSQLVDIWSYAAVLWFVLCGKPPFEGVTEGNGKGMFNKIMETPLDTSPLSEHNISEECIDFLVRMLNTDPSARPSEYECLQHPWLNNGAVLPGYGRIDKALAAIPEGEEDLDASGLSIHESPSDSNNPQEEANSSDSGESTGEHATKRHKVDELLVPRDYSEIPSGSDFSLPSITIVNEVQESGAAAPTGPPKLRRLFGEIGESALRSSALLGTVGNADEDGTALGSQHPGIAISDPGVTSEPVDALRIANNHQRTAVEQQDQAEAKPSQTTHLTAAASLLGAESMVRELNMSSPHGGNSMERRPNEPERPQTPQNEQGQPREDNPQPQEFGSQDATPKQPQPNFNRQISLPVSASFFFEPHDPATHNLEYASRVSGLQFLDESTISNIGTRSLPETTYDESGSSSAETSNSQNKENEQDSKFTAAEEPAPVATANKPPEFIKPPPRLGRLTSTSASFANVTLSLTQRVTTWGRAAGNTHIYPDGLDTRVPKNALEITFHARGIDEADKAGRDWTKMEDLAVFVRTHSRHGVRVNGVPLPEMDAKGRVCFGRLYSGDEIKVTPGEGNKGLTLACEFFHGVCARRRKDSEPKFVVEAADANEKA